MNKSLWVNFFVFGTAALALAQAGTMLYQPTRSVKDQAISLWSWGSGTLKETDEIALEGVYSLRVSTRNYFAGGAMALGTPINLSQAYGDKNNLLRIMVRLADSNLTLGGPGGGNPGGKGGGGIGAPGGGGEEGGRGGLGSPAGGQGLGAPAGGGTTTTSSADPIRNIRLIVGSADGMKSEIYVPIATSRPDAKGWISVAVPLQAINGFSKTNKIVNELGFTADSVGTFYVGDIRIVNDTTPITGDVNHADLNLALNDEVEFRARGFGGSSVLKYTWDFDDSDGVQAEAEGQVIKRKFRRAGSMNVTLTISDFYGLKSPYTTKIKVKINP